MNKPVAWLMVDRDDGNSYIQMGEPTRDDKVSHHPYPLYTHPVKELTDEEIMDVWCSTNDYDSQSEEALNFAKAILRKAQEQ